MKEIRMEADRMEICDEHGNELSKYGAHEGMQMCLGDFTTNEIGIALALYKALLDIDEKEVKIIDIDYEALHE